MIVALMTSKVIISVFQSSSEVELSGCPVDRVIHTSVSLAHTSAEGRHYYEVLGVKPNATLPQIKQAFVEISKKVCSLYRILWMSVLSISISLTSL